MCIQNGTKRFKKWQKSPFPLYDDMSFVCDAVVATGQGPSMLERLQLQTVTRVALGVIKVTGSTILQALLA